MTDEDQKWFDSWAGSYYDPATRSVVIVGDPPAYVRLHEEAHATQHARRTLKYLVWRAAQWIADAARILLEIDADQRAKAALREKGLWNEENERAARLVMRSYGLKS